MKAPERNKSMERSCINNIHSNFLLWLRQILKIEYSRNSILLKKQLIEIRENMIDIDCVLTDEERDLVDKSYEHKKKKEN
ncbi:hypothetical protein [Methanosarcina horonobensis]|uniref:hypothetical protein n=1 Tax=Methanosarcina horonobensis TaxID=418008 RepID=UPI0022B8BA79|nr:hypothetical protein [Methanosarcina horonobensis]